jgi:hypothetical protein
MGYSAELSKVRLKLRLLFCSYTWLLWFGNLEEVEDAEAETEAEQEDSSAQRSNHPPVAVLILLLDHHHH